MKCCGTEFNTSSIDLSDRQTPTPPTSIKQSSEPTRSQVRSLTHDFDDIATQSGPELIVRYSWMASPSAGDSVQIVYVVVARSLPPRFEWWCRRGGGSEALRGVSLMDNCHPQRGPSLPDQMASALPEGSDKYVRLDKTVMEGPPALKICLLWTRLAWRHLSAWSIELCEEPCGKAGSWLLMRNCGICVSIRKLRLVKICLSKIPLKSGAGCWCWC